MTCKKITLVILSVLLIVSLGSISCKHKKNNEIRVQLPSNVLSLDSAFADDAVSQEVIAGFTDGLMRFDHDGNAVPALAESYEVNDDAIIYTFSIRDAKWSNGDKVTANDFVYALRRLVDPALGADCSYMVADAVRIKNAIDILAGRMDLSELGVRAKDDSTLVIELERPCPYLLSMLTFPASSS